jgi:hypothetical protein
MDTNNNHYHLGRNKWYQQICSSETYYQIKEGETYVIKGHGSRDTWNNHYPIIFSCERVN